MGDFSGKNKGEIPDPTENTPATGVNTVGQSATGADSDVTVFSREADILGRGLVMRWNEDPEELRTLKIRNGDLMVIYEAGDFDVVSLPGSGGEESSPTEQAGSAPAPLSESEALEAWTDLQERYEGMTERVNRLAPLADAEIERMAADFLLTADHAMLVVCGNALGGDSTSRALLTDGQLRRQIWFCDTCHSMGVLLYQKDADAYSMLTRLREAHNRQHCDADPRILVPENIPEDTVLLLPLGRLVE